MKSQITMFAVVASLLSACGGEMKMYVGHRTSTWKQGTVTVNEFDDTRTVVYVYRDDRSHGLVVSGLAPDPLYFDRSNTLLSLDENQSDSKYESNASSEICNYANGTGTAAAGALTLDVKGRVTVEEQEKPETYDVVWTFLGYVE
ncbi:MAG: hypothetical protein Q8L48_13240 [Archangium sp.]|nr:hypothetical protein [Archangium sp.]